MILGCIGDSALAFQGCHIIEDKPLKLGVIPSNNTIVFQNPDCNLIFAAQGRIDNKQTLQPFVGVCASNPEYIYRAYLIWGKACPAKLLGDWLFVAYDTESEELFMARDQNGTGELLYKESANGLMFSSSIRKLIEKSKALNEKYVVSQLGFWHSKELFNQTIFKDVFKLLPGHTLSYKNKTISIERYWFPENVPLKHYSNTQDYADELLEISKEAVRCRIPDSLKVASMLSGGFDSGTVSSLTAELLGGAPLVTFSHVPLYDQFHHDYPAIRGNKSAVSNNFNDESAHIDAVVALKSNIHSFKLKSAHILPIDGIEKFVKYFNALIINGANANWLIDIYEQASAMGFEVLFAGNFGNLALSFRGIKALLPMKPGLNSLKQKLVKPMLRNLIEYRFYAQRFEGEFLNKNLAAGYKIKRDVLMNRTGAKMIFSSTQEEILHLIKMSTRNRLVWADSPLKAVQLDPTADIRIVEHVLAIPNQFFFDEKGENKQVIRKMMKGRLPDKVLLEKGKGLQTSDIFLRVSDDIDRVEAYYHRFEKNPTFRHFVDTPKLERSIRLIREQKFEGTSVINNLLKTLMLGIFLEHNGF